MGLSTCTWDVPLPGQRSFINLLAREIVSRVERLGFSKLEWWSGRDWREAQGRFHILHDTVYDKYHMRLKAEWLDQLPPEERTVPQFDSGLVRQTSSRSERDGPSMLEQIEQTLERQRQLLEEALANQNWAADAKADRSMLQETYRSAAEEQPDMCSIELGWRELCGT